MHTDDRREHLYEVLKTFSAAMLVTMDDDGGHHARPMAVAELTQEAGMCFVTSIATQKVDEINGNPDVCVSFQDSSRFASVTGTARLSRDRAKIERLWSPAWKAWFPKGKDDPEITLIEVTPSAGEYWDNAGIQGVKYLFEAARALVAGKKPVADKKQHAKVNL